MRNKTKNIKTKRNYCPRRLRRQKTQLCARRAHLAIVFLSARLGQKILSDQPLPQLILSGIHGASWGSRSPNSKLTTALAILIQSWKLGTKIMGYPSKIFGKKFLNFVSNYSLFDAEFEGDFNEPTHACLRPRILKICRFKGPSASSILRLPRSGKVLEDSDNSRKFGQFFFVLIFLVLFRIFSAYALPPTPTHFHVGIFESFRLRPHS